MMGRRCRKEVMSIPWMILLACRCERGALELDLREGKNDEQDPACEHDGSYGCVRGRAGEVPIEAIGVAGETRVASAGVCFNDMKGRPSRYSARGGLGAVLGSKGLKFIVVDDTGALGIELANKEL